MNHLPPDAFDETKTTMAVLDQPIELRPMLRGVLHLGMAVAAPFLLIFLLLRADHPREYVAAAIYAPSVLLLYMTSASYHIIPWRPDLKAIMRRLDHSMILALIAGTYTPFCLLVLWNAWGITMLALVWSLAGAGILLKVAWPQSPRWISVALGLGVGWIGLIAIAEIVTALTAGQIAALIFGGVLYSIGAFVYALKRPNPFPRVFGYHEVFHSFVILGSITHFALIARHVIA